MKKPFNIYLSLWLILFAVFNAITFFTPDEWNGMYKFGGAFWVGYAFIVIAFIGQLLIAYKALSEERKEKLFLNIPMFKVSYAGLIATIVVGAAVMLIYELPKWLGGLACFIVLAINYTAVIKTGAAAEIVDNTSKKVKESISFIRTLTADVNNLTAAVSKPEIKDLCKKLYEAVRYSDPMSIDELAYLDGEIRSEFSRFSGNAKRGDTVATQNSYNKLVALINDRNRKIKEMK